MFNLSFNHALATPLLVPQQNVKFIEAHPPRLLWPEQQKCYLKHFVNLLKHQQSLLAQGYDAKPILEAHILLLVETEMKQVLLYANAPGTSPASSLNSSPASSLNNDSYLSSLPQIPEIVKVVLPPVRLSTVRRKPPPKPLDIDVAESPLLTQKRLGSSSFTYYQCIGQGGQGKVYLSKLNGTNQLRAVKMVEKSEAQKDPLTLMRERDMLLRNGSNPFLLSLEACFRDNMSFYFVLPLCSGDLLTRLDETPNGSFDLETTRFYVAEIAMGLMHLHNQGCVHRDLKLPNVLLKPDGHICIGDFGLASTIELEAKRSSLSLCGTASHVAPEILVGEKYTPAVDWWALGIMTFVMLHGELPWKSEDMSLLASWIIHEDPECNEDLDTHAEEVIVGLLNKDPHERWTLEQLVEHAFFASICWEDIEELKAIPSYIPPASGSLDQDIAFKCYPWSSIVTDDLLPGFRYVSPEMEKQFLSAAVVEPTTPRSPTRTLVNDEDSFGLSFLGKRLEPESFLEPATVYLLPDLPLEAVCPPDIPPLDFEAAMEEPRTTRVLKRKLSRWGNGLKKQLNTILTKKGLV
ncbi:kinase-like domain-containing protein [Mycena floridula]|nr:kinase-like domain-containing protein [Mycena floridula]